VETELKSDSSLFKGLLLGGLVGIALGVLFAPLVGEDLKQKLKEKLKNFNIDELGDAFAYAFEKGKEESESVAKQMKEERM